MRHYAPRAALELVKDEREMELAIARHRARGEHVGLMLPETWLGAPGPPASAVFALAGVEGTPGGCIVFSWGPFGQLETLARRLYEGLRWLDEHQATVIVCPLPPERGIGLAIRDRLRKAAITDRE